MIVDLPKSKIVSIKHAWLQIQMALQTACHIEVGVEKAALDLITRLRDTYDIGFNWLTFLKDIILMCLINSKYYIRYCV